MRVQSVNNQCSPNFGTKVKVEKETFRLIRTLPKEAKQNIYAQIRELMHNDADDVLRLSHDENINHFSGRKGQPILRGWVSFVRNNQTYRTRLVDDGRDFIYDTVYNWDCDGKPRIANLSNIYKSAKDAALLC